MGPAHVRGSQEVTITPGKVEEVAIVCSLSNMKVSVQTTEKFRNEMAEYTVTVTSEDGVLIFGKEEIEAGRSGYFDVAPLSMDLTAVRQTGGPPCQLSCGDIGCGSARPPCVYPRCSRDRLY